MKTILHWWTKKSSPHLEMLLSVYHERLLLLSLSPPTSFLLCRLYLFITINFEHLAATQYRTGTHSQPTSCDEGRAPSQVTQHFRWAGFPVPQVWQITFFLKTENKKYMFLWAKNCIKNHQVVFSVFALNQPAIDTVSTTKLCN